MVVLRRSREDKDTGTENDVFMREEERRNRQLCSLIQSMLPLLMPSF